MLYEDACCAFLAARADVLELRWAVSPAGVDYPARARRLVATEKRREFLPIEQAVATASVTWASISRCPNSDVRLMRYPAVLIMGGISFRGTYGRRCLCSNGTTERG